MIYIDSRWEEERGIVICPWLYFKRPEHASCWRSLLWHSAVFNNITSLLRHKDYGSSEHGEVILSDADGRWGDERLCGIAEIFKVKGYQWKKMGRRNNRLGSETSTLPSSHPSIELPVFQISNFTTAWVYQKMISGRREEINWNIFRV